MKLFYLLFLCVFSIFYTFSCYIPPQLLGSTPSTNNNNNNKDDDNDGDDEGDNDSTNDRNFCWNRDSCQDTCDSLFRMQTARHQCSELTYREVNTLAEVSDLLATKVEEGSGDMKIGTINSRDLEDINSKDLDLYLQIGFKSLLDTVENSTASQKNSLHQLIKWVAENEDIAEVIAKYDTQHELGYWLFYKTSQVLFSTQVSDIRLRVSENITGNDDAHYVLFNTSNKEASIDGSHLFDINDDFEINKIGNFIAGFIDVRTNLSNEPFLNHADYEENEAAIKWGNNTLVSFCESISSGHVKQCLQMLYCAHRFIEEGKRLTMVVGTAGTLIKEFDDVSDGIFSWMEDREDIFGRTDVGRCSSDELQKEDRFDNLFNSEESA